MPRRMPGATPTGIVIALGPGRLTTGILPSQHVPGPRHHRDRNPDRRGEGLEEFPDRLGWPPTLMRWQALGRYAMRTACCALGVDRWHRVLEAAGLASDEDRALEAAVGGFQLEMRCIDKNPIAVWVGRNPERPSVFFAWQDATSTFRYISPRPAGPDSRCAGPERSSPPGPRESMEG